MNSRTIDRVETGRSSENGTQKEQANYLNSIYTSFNHLIDKIFIYELKDNYGLLPKRENYFGLLTVNGNKKEAYNRLWEISGRWNLSVKCKS